MNDLGTGIQILSLSGKSNAGELHFCPLALEDTHGVQIGHMRTERTGNPFHLAALFDQCTLGIQVVHVLRPVFNGGVPQCGILAHVQLHTAGVEVRHVVLRSGAALDKVQVCSLFHDDQRMFKLSCSRCIQTEIGLQRNLHGHALRHVYKGTAGPDCTVQSRKLMVCRRHQLHEVFADHVRIFAVHGTLQIGIHYAQIGNFLPHIVVHQLGVILCSHTGKGLSLCLRNAQTFEGILDVLRHVGPLGFHIGIGADIGNNVVHVQPVDRRTPVRHLQFVVDLEGVQTELLHPDRIILFFGDLFYQCRCQAGINFIGISFCIFNIVDTSVNICDLLFFFHAFSPFRYSCNT